MIAQIESFIERDALPLAILALSLIFARALPWILAEIAK